MVGGGSFPQPGEISLAHNGVLFLDELPEFNRGVLEVLRQPLEDGYVNVTRVSGQARYQSRCMLVAGMNPCPCGNHGSKTRACRCKPYEIQRYLARISGPLLDRIDPASGALHGSAGPGGRGVPGGDQLRALRVYAWLGLQGRLPEAANRMRSR